MKVLSLKLKDEVFSEAEKLLEKIHCFPQRLYQSGTGVL